MKHTLTLLIALLLASCGHVACGRVVKILGRARNASRGLFLEHCPSENLGRGLPEFGRIGRIDRDGVWGYLGRPPKETSRWILYCIRGNSC